jgi:hypothetical protein
VTTVHTVEEFLRGVGVRDPQVPALLKHIGDRYRTAHLHRHSVDPGDQIIDRPLADRVLDDYTVMICRNCERSDGVGDGDGDGTCTSCGLGMIDPADRPAGILVPSDPLPIGLGGIGRKKCSQCARPFIANTYVVVVNIPGGSYAPLCRWCVQASPELNAWQGVCDIADLIDLVMQEAVDAKQRRMFVRQIEHMADHFSEWRQDEDANPPADPS